MTATTASILDTTMDGLEVGLQVGHIASRDIRTCTPDQTTADVREDPAHEDLDCLPVKSAGRFVGVLESPEQSERPVKAVMEPLAESMLVSGSMPIADFVRQLEKDRSRCWLVVEGNSICGIVTRSDLLKLPVRLFAFALATHLEMMMARLITSRMSDDDWLAWLEEEDRHEAVFKKQKELERRGLDPRRIELTEFCDKRIIVKRLMGYPGRFEKDMKRIEWRLRNTIAHAGNYAPDDSSLEKFIDAVIKSEQWIKTIDAELDSVATNATAS
ncbi:hypothetical protein BH23CHL2_BH23CHL2_24200 [soil metagenome]